jgi:hypothetical protein
MFNIWQRSNPAENVLLKSVTKELGMRVDPDRIKGEEQRTGTGRELLDRTGGCDHEEDLRAGS